MESILAIETSVPEASIALWSDGDWLFEAEFVSDRNHNSMVFEPLAEALALLEGRELSTVLVGTGPGSYSGTRIGIAAAQGLAIAKSCPAAGIGSIAATPPARSVARPAARPATALPTNEQGHSLTTSPSLQPLRCPRPALALTPAQRRHKSASSNRRPCVGVELVDDLELASHLGDALPASAGGTR